MAQNVKYRPATMAEIEGRDVELYMNGERVWVMMIHRSEAIGEDSEPKLDYIMLTNMKKVQPKDLQVIDDTPEDSETKQINNSNNNQNSTTMETKNIQAADLIGKTIKVKDSTNYYVVKSADGDTLQTEMHMGERVMPCPMPMTLLKTMLDAGKYVIGEDAEVKVTDPTPAPPLDGRGAATASEPTVQEPKSEDAVAEGEIVDKPTAQEPVAQTVTMQPTTKPTTKPATKAKNDGAAAPRPSKGKAASKREQSGTRSDSAEREQARPEVKGRGGVTPAAKLTYQTYTNAKGKTCARIVGFAEGDAMLERGNAERIHASSTYERDKKGNKCYMLIFGPRYAEAAKDVCKALNQGKTLADCQAIIDQATEERVQKREEWKARRAAYLAGKDDNGAKAEAQAEVKQDQDGYAVEMLERLMTGGKLPDAILNRINPEVIKTFVQKAA